ncbi:DUF6969 family protein [Afifella pfennigii]|uniref:DUF6969 family protein n=1 Tax=Afifella pfennigii TaxID=209897 RepID=UPI00047AC1E8|nr:hypothetical protein [Afifella pfennigii]
MTDETFYPARTVSELLARFAIAQKEPSPELNGWLTAMLALFRRQIDALLEERDRVIAATAAVETDGAKTVLEDRALQNLCETPIDLLAQISAVEAALGIETPIHLA